jgi:enterochelin esterase-like enzyme
VGEPAGGSAGDAGAGGNAAGAGGAAAGAAGAPTGGTGSGGQSGAAGAAAGGMGGGGVTACPTVNAEVASSIPAELKQPIANPGQVSKVSYPVYYYTDLTARPNTTDWTLPRRDQPITKQCNVYLPPGYDDQITYPTIYVMHGITDNEETWFERGSPRPNVLLDNLIQTNRIQPVIAVFPNGNATSTFLNRDFSNQAGYYYFGNELVNDLVPFIESRYSVKKDRASRALAGFSMGGMQTINVGLCQNLSSFAWFGAFAAAPSSYSSDQVTSFLNSQNEAASYPVCYFYNVVGQSDSTAGSSHGAAVQGFPQKAAEYLSTSNFAYHQISGGHDYPTVSVGLYNTLRIAFGK